MKLSTVIGFALFLQGVTAHYIFTALQVSGRDNTAAVRQPLNNTPVESASSPNLRCNVNPRPATEVVTVAAGSQVVWKVDISFYHSGPAAVYLGKAPGDVAQWDGSGQSWFKIAEFGATFNPFNFVTANKNTVSATIPASTPPGDYLIRAEQIGLHVAGSPQWYISCAQIRITGNGGGNPPLVSIPGYVSASDPGLTVNIYYPVPTSYTVPGPAVWRG